MPASEKNAQTNFPSQTGVQQAGSLGGTAVSLRALGILLDQSSLPLSESTHFRNRDLSSNEFKNIF